MDTRALTALIRDKGMPNAMLAHDPKGRFDIASLKAKAKAQPSMEGLDLVPLVTGPQRYSWDETSWHWGKGYGRQSNADLHVVALDFGAKRNILRLLAERGCRVTVLPPTASTRM